MQRFIALTCIVFLGAWLGMSVGGTLVAFSEPAVNESELAEDIDMTTPVEYELEMLRTQVAELEMTLLRMKNSIAKALGIGDEAHNRLMANTLVNKQRIDGITIILREMLERPQAPLKNKNLEL